MGIFKLEHTGHWLGGVIIVSAKNIEYANGLIEDTLYENGVKDEEFDLSNTEEVGLLENEIIYLSKGDY